ncbi:hypothetical protein [Kaistia adipata]|uniref:hypothetical protein n=1 Tax=Kaistia adipata TaxID=166954 RepID=UPI00040656A3|nr:hypothetical protein [Kaistia adipata]
MSPLPGTHTILAALTRDAGVSHEVLRTRTKPPVGTTGDESADAYLAGIFAMICVMEGQAGDRAKQVRFVQRAIEIQEDWIDRLQEQGKRGVVDLPAQRTSSLSLGRLQAWLAELRGDSLELLGQDIVEGRRATA